MKKNNNKSPSLAMSMLINSAYLSAEATELGNPAPQFILPTLQQDHSVALKDKLGKVIYLDFWASWCAPCRSYFPLLNVLHEKLKAQAFEVIAISLDDNKAKAEKFLTDIPVSFSVLHDSDGEWSDQYVIESMPTAFIIDQQGIVQHIQQGFSVLDMNAIETKITELLAKN
ncbi:TlpA family protein disulfide reductase [Crenothrix polyspora]|uniref:Redoxin domain protein n=1 Tax=Crenothrix polyspora TaxID=360316 RepID=A0A1R4H2I2_9GAMM|nr:TlpA disulfide reductase family protein [Crenothrix polyspora]SJM90464.1 Redoxin domain protein [Crenothrix polyspora]